MWPWLVFMWQLLSDLFRPERLTRLAVRRDGRHYSVPGSRIIPAAPFAPQSPRPRRPLSADRTRTSVVTLVSFLRSIVALSGMPPVFVRAMVAFFSRGTALGPRPQAGRSEDALSGG